MGICDLPSLLAIKGTAMLRRTNDSDALALLDLQRRVVKQHAILVPVRELLDAQRPLPVGA